MFVPVLPLLGSFGTFGQAWSYYGRGARLARKCQKWSTMIQYVLLRGMSIYGHIWHSASHSVQFWSINSELTTYAFDAKEWQTLYNTASKSPVWPRLISGDHVCCRIWSMNDLVNIEAEERNLGLRHQVMAEIALWCKFEHTLPKVAYNGPIYIF